MDDNIYTNEDFLTAEKIWPISMDQGYTCAVEAYTLPNDARQGMVVMQLDLDYISIHGTKELYDAAFDAVNYLLKQHQGAVE